MGADQSKNEDPLAAALNECHETEGPPCNNAELIGKGGFGSVYSVFNVGQTAVVLKVLKNRTAAKKEFENTPVNTQYVLELQQHSTLPILAMPYCSWPTLMQHPEALVCGIDTLLSFTKKIVSLFQVGGVFNDYAHHDLSPNNILVDPSNMNNFVIIDWGLACKVSDHRCPVATKHCNCDPGGTPGFSHVPRFALRNFTCKQCDMYTIATVVYKMSMNDWDIPMRLAWSLDDDSPWTARVKASYNNALATEFIQLVQIISGKDRF